MTVKITPTNTYRFDFKEFLREKAMNEGSTGDSHEFDNEHTSGKKGNPGDKKENNERPNN